MKAGTFALALSTSSPSCGARFRLTSSWSLVMSLITVVVQKLRFSVSAFA